MNRIDTHLCCPRQHGERQWRGPKGSEGKTHHITFWIIFKRVNYHFPRSDMIPHIHSYDKWPIIKRVEMRYYICNTRDEPSCYLRSLFLLESRSYDHITCGYGLTFLLSYYIEIPIYFHGNTDIKLMLQWDGGGGGGGGTAYVDIQTWDWGNNGHVIHVVLNVMKNLMHDEVGRLIYNFKYDLITQFEASLFPFSRRPNSLRFRYRSSFWVDEWARRFHPFLKS